MRSSRPGRSRPKARPSWVRSARWPWNVRLCRRRSPIRWPLLCSNSPGPRYFAIAARQAGWLTGHRNETSRCGQRRGSAYKTACRERRCCRCTLGSEGHSRTTGITRHSSESGVQGSARTSLQRPIGRLSRSGGWRTPEPNVIEPSLSLIHISEPTRPPSTSRMPSSA